MEGDDADSHQLEDVSFWKAMGGAALHIPAAATAVWYYPYQHAEACRAHLADSALPNQILAMVSRCRLRTNGIDVFAEYELKCLHPPEYPACPMAAEIAVNMIGGEEMGAMEEGVNVYTKRLPTAEVGRSNSCYISTRFAEALFPPLAPRFHQYVNYRNLSGQARFFEHRRIGTGYHYLGSTTEWDQFRNDHQPEESELLVIARRGNDYLAGIRRNQQRSARPTPQEMADVQADYIDGQPLRVRYYPNVSQEYVVLAAAVRKGNRLQNGAMVEFVVEGAHGNSVVVNGVVHGKEGEDYGAQITVVSDQGEFVVPAWKVRQ